MEKTRYSRIEDMLVRVPGLRVLRSAGGGIALEIRGNGAVTGEPLLVIDQLPIHSDAGSALATLHPRDVVRIDVLKDVSAAIYGIRGGNGVVIITTRRGRKAIQPPNAAQGAMMDDVAPQSESQTRIQPLEIGSSIHP